MSFEQLPVEESHILFSLKLNVSNCEQPDALASWEPLSRFLPNMSDYLHLFPSAAPFHFSEPIAATVVQETFRRVQVKELRLRLGLERRDGREQLLDVSPGKRGLGRVTVVPQHV